MNIFKSLTHLFCHVQPAGSASTKWRFYKDGIVNLACGGMKGNLAITSMKDDSFSHIPTLDDIHFSLVNPSTGMAVSVGADPVAEVSRYWKDSGQYSCITMNSFHIFHCYFFITLVLYNQRRPSRCCQCLCISIRPNQCWLQQCQGSIWMANECMVF